MTAAVGIDLVDVGRIDALVARYGERFLRRILTVEERSLYAKRFDRAQFLAGRFAAKEAAIKALGRYLAIRPPLTDIQITNDSDGQPRLRLDAALTEKLGRARMQVSISHERSHAIAIVMISEDA